MKTQNFSSIFTLLFFQSAFICGQPFIYQKKFTAGGTNISSAEIAATRDTGNIFTSIIRTSTSTVQWQLYLSKFDKFGNINWSKIYGSGLNADYTYNPINTLDNGYFFSGQSYGTGVGSGQGDVLALKIDSIGNVVWSKLIGTASNEFALNAVEQPDSTYLLIGGTDSILNNDRDFLLVKLDYNGNLIFSKYYGDSLYDDGENIFSLGGDGILIAGSKRNSGVTLPDAYLIKLDNLGNVMWSKTYGSSDLEDIFKIIPTLDFGYLLCGRSASGSIWRGLIIKVDSTGNLQWSKTYTSTINVFNFYNCIPTVDSSFILCGASSAAFTMKIDSVGNLKWANSYNHGFGSDCCLNANGDISFALLKSADTLVLVKVDPDGNSCTETPYPITINSVSLQSTDVITNSGDIGVILNYPIPNSIYTPYQQYECITTSTDLIPHGENDISLFPNPSNGKFIFKSNHAITALEIYNTIGEKVYSNFNMQQGEANEINISSLPAGIYFLRVFDGEKYFARKVVIE